jgi:hypothetical protein
MVYQEVQLLRKLDPISGGSYFTKGFRTPKVPNTAKWDPDSIPSCKKRHTRPEAVAKLEPEIGSLQYHLNGTAGVFLGPLLLTVGNARLAEQGSDGKAKTQIGPLGHVIPADTRKSTELCIGGRLRSAISELILA